MERALEYTVHKGGLFSVVGWLLGFCRLRFQRDGGRVVGQCVGTRQHDKASISIRSR